MRWWWVVSLGREEGSMRGVEEGTVKDKILVPKPPKNCARCTRCGYLVDGLNCQGCALLRQELEENLVTYSLDFWNSSEPSNASTNVVNAPREPYVVKQDNGSFVEKNIFRAPDSPDQFHCFHCKDMLRYGEACKRCTCTKCGSGLGKGLCYICGHNQNSLNDSPNISETSSQSPPNINHCCYECGVPLDSIFCKHCTCNYCGKDAHIGYNCPSKVSVISNPEPCNNQTIDELLQTLLIFHLTFQSKAESPFTLDSTPTYVDESPNVFNPPPQSSVESKGIPEHVCDVPSHDNSPPLDVSKDTIKDFSESNEEFSSTDDDFFSFDKINYVEASPPDSELVSSEVMEIVITEVRGIKASNDNPILSYDPIIPGNPPNLTPSGESDFFLEINAILAVDDESTSSQFPNSYLDPEWDMLLFKAFLNDDHSFDFKTKSSSTSLNSLLEETNNFHNSLPEFTTFSKVFFDAECESDSSDDQSCSDEDVLKKIVLKPMFEEEIIPMKSLRSHDSSLSISSKIDSLLDEFAGELTLLKSIPPGIDETDCDFEEDIRLIEKLLYDNFFPSPPEKFVSANSDAKIKSFSPSPILVKDSDSLMEEIDLFYGDTGILNIKMMGDIYDHKAFMHQLMITLASHQETSPDLLSHRCGTVKKFNTYRSHLNTCPILFHGQNNPPVDVLLFHFIPLDSLKYGENFRPAHLTLNKRFNPGKLYWVAVKHILKYLRNTRDMFLVYGGKPDIKLNVTGFCDASWQCDKDDTKSQTGYVFVINGGAVDWKTKKQTTIAMHSAQAEYAAASEAALEAVWIRNFVGDLGVMPSINKP
nr:retrotransposon protein, putative, Ty1-copia subclass [Tanacetum cinerariifolium]